MRGEVGFRWNDFSIRPTDGHMSPVLAEFFIQENVGRISLRIIIIRGQWNPIKIGHIEGASGPRSRMGVVGACEMRLNRLESPI